MKIDGGDKVIDLTSKTAVKKHLISEYDANRMLSKEQRKNELGILEEEQDKMQRGKGKDHVYWKKDGRLLVTDSDSEDDGRNKGKQSKKGWKNLSDDEEEDAQSDSDLDIDG